MDYTERKIKDIIRERIWDGMVIVSGVKQRENPHAVSELLHQNKDRLNDLTNSAYEDIKKMGALNVQ